MTERIFTPLQRTTMDALYVLPVVQLASALKMRVESTLSNGQCVWLGSLPVANCALIAKMQNSFGVLFVECTYLRQPHNPLARAIQVLAIEEDLSKALLVVRSIRNTFAPINKLHPELLAYITTFFDDPLGGVADCTDLQFFCAAVCRYWRNSLLAFPGIWSSVNTASARHMGLHLPRSKKAPLHVNYGRMTSRGVFEQRIIPERHRLRSLTISLGPASHQDVAQSLLESAESLRTLGVRTTDQMFSIPATTMEAISQFARHIMILRLHDITTSLSSLKFPALAKLTFLITTPTTRKPGAADLVKFLKQSPILEELNLRLPESFKADKPADTVALPT
jgi:hypothetical protein